MKKNNSLTQSLCRAFDILNCLTSGNHLRVTDIANKLNLTSSNVSRLLATMMSYGYVEKDEVTGTYHIGTEIIYLSSVALNNFEIRKQAMPELYALESRLGLGANLAIHKKNKIFYLAHVDSHKSPRMYTMIGYTNPLHCTAIGKVLLAYMDPDDTKKIISEEGLIRYTTNTIVDEQELYKQLKQVRENGYSIENEEMNLGRTCIAAPIRNSAGEVIAAISLSGPVSEMCISDREEELSQIIIESTNLVSNKMGWFI